MNFSSSVKIQSFALFVGVILGGLGTVFGQGGGGTSLEGNRGREPLTATGSASSMGGSGGSGGGGGGGRTNRPPIVRYRTVEKKVYLNPTTGTLSVSTTPNALISLERVGANQDLDPARMPADGTQAVFNKLTPGNYRVTAELDGYTSAESSVEISKNDAEGITLTLKPLSYTVTIQTNVPDGEVRFARLSYRDPVTGVEKSSQPSGVCLEAIRNGRVTLKDLTAGRYGIDIRANDVGYATKFAEFSLPGGTALSANLVRNESTRTFSATWTAGEWDLPGGWNLGSTMLINGPGKGLPHQEIVRYYKNFNVTTEVKMANGVGVSFILRAQDSQNYYLVRITGPNDPEPYKLLGYVVKNGVRQPHFDAINISHLKEDMRPGQYFNIEMQVRGSTISVRLNSLTGNQWPLGDLKETFNNYPIGAPGLAGTDNERTQVSSFVITPTP